MTFSLVHGLPPVLSILFKVVTTTCLALKCLLTTSLNLSFVSQPRASTGGGRGGRAPPPPLFSLGGQHRKCPPTFSVKKQTNLKAYSEADHSSLLKQTLRLVVKLIYQFKYQLPTTQWKITRQTAWLAAARKLILVQYIFVMSALSFCTLNYFDIVISTSHQAHH